MDLERAQEGRGIHSYRYYILTVHTKARSIRQLSQFDWFKSVGTAALAIPFAANQDLPPMLTV